MQKQYLNCIRATQWFADYLQCSGIEPCEVNVNLCIVKYECEKPTLQIQDNWTKYYQERVSNGRNRDN